MTEPLGLYFTSLPMLGTNTVAISPITLSCYVSGYCYLLPSSVSKSPVLVSCSAISPAEPVCHYSQTLIELTGCMSFHTE